jgi:hypothetical protein
VVEATRQVSVAFLAGVIAGEGCFLVGSLDARVDGSPRLRFRFSMQMADRDEAILEALRRSIGVGSISHEPPRHLNCQPTATYSVSGRKGLREALIPFCDRYLLTSHKRTQYLRWREQFTAYEERFPSNWGAGPSPCSVPGCDKPVRGRGLCRAHYYRETGY